MSDALAPRKRRGRPRKMAAENPVVVAEKGVFLIEDDDPFGISEPTAEEPNEVFEMEEPENEDSAPPMTNLAEEGEEPSQDILPQRYRPIVGNPEDLEIPLLVRGLYLEGLQQAAAARGVTLQAHVQKLLDHLIEEEAFRQG